MLNSSSEYLQALREGKYLRFLEWPQFIAEHYKNQNKSQDADDTLNLLVFEWLNNGYSEDDAKIIALLYAVHEHEDKPLKGNLSYALISISIAVLQCMTLHSNNLHHLILTKEKLNIEKINTLMDVILIYLDDSVFDDLLEKKRLLFFSWIDGLDKKKVNVVFHQISPIANLRHLIERYISDLEMPTLKDDQLKSSRLSVVKRLALYLKEQMGITPVVSEEITSYANQIRKMQPAHFEEQYLTIFSPLSFTEITWRWGTDFGLSIFNLLQPSKSETLAVVPSKELQVKDSSCASIPLIGK